MRVHGCLRLSRSNYCTKCGRMLKEADLTHPLFTSNDLISVTIPVWSRKMKPSHTCHSGIHKCYCMDYLSWHKITFAKNISICAPRTPCTPHCTQPQPFASLVLGSRLYWKDLVDVQSYRQGQDGWKGWVHSAEFSPWEEWHTPSNCFFYSGSLMCPSI